MNYLSHIAIRSLLAIVLVAAMSAASAQDKEVRIGVLSFRPLEQTRQQWQATNDYLNSHLAGGYHFTMEPLFFPELDKAIDERRFDFVLTNPEHYVATRDHNGLAVIATLMPLAAGHPVDSFGGVIFARTDRDDIKALVDIRGKIVSAVAEHSFGGYVVQRWTLFERGIQIGEAKNVNFTGMPQDNPVLQVLKGEADIGFVRTGILESMAREGKIKLGELKVLNLQPSEKFPQMLSTELYPEWAFSAAPDVPEKLIKAVHSHY